MHVIPRRLSRDEKAKLLGVEIGDAGNRVKPLGRIEETEGGIWKWLLTRFDDGVEHRLLLVAEDPMAFGVWLHTDRHIDLLKCKPFRTVPNRLAITSHEWARIAKAAQENPTEGISHITYHAAPLVRGPRTTSRWVSVAEAAERMDMSHDGVRKRIRTGQLNARRIRRGAQYYYEVDMSNAPVQAEMPITEAPVEPLIAPPAPRVTFVEPTPAAVPAPAPTAPANPTIAMVVRLFERLDTATQAETLQRLMEITYP